MAPAFDFDDRMSRIEAKLAALAPTRDELIRLLDLPAPRQRDGAAAGQRRVLRSAARTIGRGLGSGVAMLRAFFRNKQ